MQKDHFGKCNKRVASFQQTFIALQLVQVNSQWVNMHAVVKIDGAGLVEFPINGTSDNYLALNDTYLYLQIKVRKHDGHELPVDTNT